MLKSVCRWNWSTNTYLGLNMRMQLANQPHFLLSRCKANPLNIPIEIPWLYSYVCRYSFTVTLRSGNIWAGLIFEHHLWRVRAWVCLWGGLGAGLGPSPGAVAERVHALERALGPRRGLDVQAVHEVQRGVTLDWGTQRVNHFWLTAVLQPIRGRPAALQWVAVAWK